MDCIHLTGIRAYGYTGLLPEEQALGQWFEVDLTLWLDLSRAGESDRIEDTHDYRTTIATVKQMIKTSDVKLIEKLAAAIADAALTDSQIDQVRVRLSKPAAPIPDFEGQIAVEITRTAKAR